MSNIEVFTHGNEIIIWFELVNFVLPLLPLKICLSLTGLKLWHFWGFSFLFMPECQINYFVSTINLFYVGEITDSDDIYFPGYL